MVSPTGSVCPEVEMSDVTSDRWLSVDEIAAYLGVKRYTIYKWIERKKHAGPQGRQFMEVPKGRN